jgi:serine/threonine protein phosphatase PrpC
MAGRQPSRSATQASPEVAAATVSHIGASPRRTLLEDRGRAGVVRRPDGLTFTLGVVADGIGGANAGERAAELTVNTVFEHSRHAPGSDIPEILEAALVEANRRVHTESRHSRRKSNMGSTAAVAAIANNRLYVANVGDSRVYLVRGHQVSRLTVDHTWEREIVASGRLTAAEAARHPRRDEIVRSVGYEATIDVDLGLWLQGGEEDQARARSAQGLPLEPGDLVLICSDGLTKTRHDNPRAHYVEEADFPAVIKDKPTKQAAEALVRRALAAKVDDNVTVVLLEVPGRHIASRPPGIYVGAGAASLILVVGAAVFLPRALGLSHRQEPIPTIPPLPSGVAFVSDFAGEAEIEEPGNSARPLKSEEIVAARSGVVLRTIGSDSYIRLGLADQSIVCVGPDTEIELLAIADGTRVQETTLIVSHGVLLASTDPDSDLAFAVRTPLGLSARILDSLMGVIFDDRLQQMDVDCFSDQCEVGTGVIGELPYILQAGEHLTIGVNGQVSQASGTRNELYAFAGFGGGLVATPTSAGAGGKAGATPTRTPLGPLFVPPTSTPVPPPTSRPPERTEPPVGHTKAPTQTPTAFPTKPKTNTPTEVVLPSATRTYWRSRTPTTAVPTTQEPSATEETLEPVATDTPVPTEAPTDVPTEAPTEEPVLPPDETPTGT